MPDEAQGPPDGKVTQYWSASNIESKDYCGVVTASRAQLEPPASTEELVQLFFAAVGRVKHHFADRSAEFDLSFPHAMALRFLDEPQSMSELASRLHCDASNVTGIVDRLEERGLVQRQALPGDRRVKRLILTAPGRKMLREHHARLATGSPLATLSDDERRVLAELLRRIATAPHSKSDS